jgi:hypothetical protein
MKKAKMPFPRKISAENGIFALFSPKILTWQTMPFKVGIIATFRGLLSDCSPFYRLSDKKFINCYKNA